MKRGDLVKHPKGMMNVCKKTYSMGIVLGVYSELKYPAGETQVKVLWNNLDSYLVYHHHQLEVICGGR